MIILIYKHEMIAKKTNLIMVAIKYLNVVDPHTARTCATVKMALI